jgi:tetratricopeptide (TPR) repeat protein
MIYVLNRAVCQTNLQRYDEAQKDLFRLNYEQPDDLAVQRVLAWTLTCAGKYEQALHMYQQLTALAEAEADDFLNQGYCLWFSGGGMQETVDSFRRYLKETGEAAYSVISSEQALLEAKGIRESEMFMMLDAISS